MTKEKNVYELLMERQSCRDFSSRDIEEEIRFSIRRTFQEAVRLVPGRRMELKFLDGSDAGRLGVSVGYNGFRIPAPAYLFLLTEAQPHALENAGFVGQQLTLALTKAGLAACWQTVNDAAAAAAAVRAPEGMKAAAVIAMGYRNRTKREVRLDIKSPSDVKLHRAGGRTAPKIALEDFAFDRVYGQQMDVAEVYPQLQDGLRAMSLAQSFFNRSPYRVVTDGTLVCLIGLPDEMTEEKDMLLNYGITMYDFYAVISEGRREAPNWTFGAPEGLTGDQLELPEGAGIVAWYKL